MTAAVLRRTRGERDRLHPIATLMIWQGIGLVMLTCYVYLSAEVGQTLSSLLFLPAAVLLYAADPLAGFVVFLQFLLYQNLAISTAAPLLSVPDFRMLQGTSFLLWTALAAVAFGRLWLYGTVRERRYLLSLACITTVFIGYALVGAQRASFSSAAIYFRLASTAIVGVLVGMDVGRRYGYRLTAICFLASAVLGVCLSTIETVNPDRYYEAINATDYFSLKALAGEVPPRMFYSSQDVIDLLTRSFFNFGGDATYVRFNGPNMHPISYAYVLALAGIAAFSLGWWLYAAALLPLIFLIGVKGAGILLLITALLLAVRAVLGRAALLIVASVFAVAYVVAVIWHGTIMGDYHVIGLLGGLRGFLGNPLGHGLGVGGNLSVADTGTAVNWESFQYEGADYGLESAIGVLLYQVGIVTFGLLAVLWWSAKRVSAQSAERVHVLPIALFVLTLNGFFQEEAFSPYALGLLMLLAGAASTSAGIEHNAHMRRSTG